MRGSLAADAVSEEATSSDEELEVFGAVPPRASPPKAAEDEWAAVPSNTAAPAAAAAQRELPPPPPSWPAPAPPVRAAVEPAGLSTRGAPSVNWPACAPVCRSPCPSLTALATEPPPLRPDVHLPQGYHTDAASPPASASGLESANDEREPEASEAPAAPPPPPDEEFDYAFEVRPFVAPSPACARRTSGARLTPPRILPLRPGQAARRRDAHGEVLGARHAGAPGH